MPLQFCYDELTVGWIISMGPFHGLKCVDVDCIAKCKGNVPAIRRELHIIRKIIIHPHRMQYLFGLQVHNSYERTLGERNYVLLLWAYAEVNYLLIHLQ